VDRLGGELFTARDPIRAAHHWERYAQALRAVPEPTGWERSELATASATLERFTGRR
jgi:hypothetical protein